MTALGRIQPFGVVTVGLFALRGANVILLGTETGVKTITVWRPA